MISLQILQNTIEGLKEIGRSDFAVYDPAGKELASTLEGRLPEEDIRAFSESGAESRELEGCQIFRVVEEQGTEYILACWGGSDPYMLGRLCVFQMEGLLNAYREQFNQDSFIKNLLLDNLLLVDIYNRARMLHIKSAVPRLVLLVEDLEERQSIRPEDLKEMPFIREGDFVASVDDRDVVIIEELLTDSSLEEAEGLAEQIIPFLKKHMGVRARVSSGTVVQDLRDVSRSYKEAKVAMEVGKIFLKDTQTAFYRRLGIGRLIYQLPLPLCRMFIQEIFAEKPPEDFDEETLATIDKFFENSLNVSETSRQLFIHRNTLVYRLDKIEKTTGLDIRVFEDAITFRIALMVSRYMKYMENMQ
ncbi:MAG: helix-turn-helix domain-containing protein [Lachnospiraceae bacterium]|nr:helix-turn-helix domain-containing protein [Lachnospiraceae bacterium]